MAMKPGGNGNLKDSKDTVLWRYNKGAAYVPSPIAVGDYLYLVSDTGIIISNGKGAIINMVGPSTDINASALTII